MRPDLKSVGNGATSTIARAFAPKMCESAVSRLRMSWTFLKTYLELFPASPGAQLREVTFGTFPIQLGKIQSRTGIGSEKKTFFLDPIGDCNRI